MPLRRRAGAGARHTDEATLPGPTLSGLLVLAMFCGTFSLAALSALGPFLTEDLDLTRVELGALSSAVFLAGVLASVLVGRRIDRLADRPLMLGLFALSGVTVLAMAGAPDYGWLLVAVAASGIGVAAANPATNALLSRQRAQGARGWMLGIKLSGQPSSMLLAGFLLPPLASAVGWRWAVLTIASFAILGLAWTRARIRLQPVPTRPTAPSDQPGGRRPSFRLLAYALLMGLGMSGIAAHLPLFTFEELGVSPALAGTTTAAIGASGIAGRLLWARTTERARNSLRMLVAVAAGSTLPMAALLVARPSTWWLAWLGAAGLGLFAHSWNAAATIALLREVATDSVARASALLQVTFFTGLTLSPLLVGSIGDRFGSLRPAWTVMIVVYLSAAAIAATMRRASR